MTAAVSDGLHHVPIARGTVSHPQKVGHLHMHRVVIPPVGVRMKALTNVEAPFVRAVHLRDPSCPHLIRITIR